MKFVVYAVLILIATSTVVDAATYYPDDGNLWYNGQFYADSYLKWNSPGNWSKSDPGYEHDLAVRMHYFKSCTSWTNLPSGYNDCPTAGILEPGTFWAFSFGSFHAKNIGANRWYFGSWNFATNNGVSTDFYLNGQEVFHQYCGWDSIWCMGGIRSQRLVSGWLNWNQSLYRSW